MKRSTSSHPRMSWAGNKLSFSLGLFLTLATGGAGAFTIDLDYSHDANDFFADTGRRDVLQAAASYFESIISDDLLAITSGAGNSFDAVFTDPATGGDATIFDFSIAADTIKVFAGGRVISGSTLGVGGPGGFGCFGFGSFCSDAGSRGEGTT